MSKTSIVLLNAFPDKKIKSFGNKCLLKINHKFHVIDYHIQTFKKIFKDPQIIVVGGFDGKRLNKYISQNFKNKDNIVYTEHDVTHQNNVGASIVKGLEIASSKNVFIINSSFLLRKKISQFIDTSSSFVGTINTSASAIGYIKENDTIINCYYGLPNEILDILYVTKNDIQKLYDIVSQNDIEKYYLFELINLCIQYGIKFKPVVIPKGSLYSIDSCAKIKNLNKLSSKYA